MQAWWMRMSEAGAALERRDVAVPDAGAGQQAAQPDPAHGDGAAHVPLSGKTMEFDAAGRCVKGC